MSNNTVKVTVRDKEYEIYPLSLGAVEAMWPLLSKAKDDRDNGHVMTLPETTDYACAVLSIAILDSCPDSGMDKDTLKKNIPFRDVNTVQATLAEILKQSGLTAGEETPSEETANPSTETSKESVQS